MTLPTAPETLVSRMRGVLEEEGREREEEGYRVEPSSSCEELRKMNFFLAGSPSDPSCR